METYYRWRPHPWHGLSPGPSPPSVVSVFVEITPFDLVKYEVDKVTGYLRVDRAQKTSSLPPAIYGFIPQTYAGASVAALMPGCTGGDHDPLDICVLSERPMTRAEVIVHAQVVGGLPMLDRGEADDKIVAILRGDPVFGGITEIDQVPEALMDRLVHYFSTYKLFRVGSRDMSVGGPDAGSGDVAVGSTDAGSHDVTVGTAYGRQHAEAVISAAMADYEKEFARIGDSG